VYATNTYTKSVHFIAEYEYNSFDELKTKITSIYEKLDDLKLNTYDTTTEIEKHKKSIRVLEYLLENKITYNEFITNTADTAVEMYAADKLDYTLNMLSLCGIFLLIIIIQVASTIINYDFSTGLYKQIYVHEDRKKIILKKFLAYECFLGIITSLLFLLVFLTGLVFKTNYQNVLIISQTNIYIISSISYCILGYLAVLCTISLFSILIFAVCLLIKNMYFSILVNVIIVALYALLSSMSSGTVVSLVGEFNNYQAGSLEIGVFTAIYIVRIILVIGFLFLSRYVFLKKDL
jgi:ABC-type transport system involved in multi-copper enzyme maturation permease subunit